MKKVLLPVFFLLSVFFKDTAAQTHCTPTANNPCQGGTASSNPTISNFTLNTINNNSGCSPGSYMDYPAIQTTLTSPGSYPYSVTSPSADLASPYSVNIWIDLNEDGDFSDAGERVAYRTQQTNCAFTCGATVRSGTATIPAGVTPGTKRLRVRIVFYGDRDNQNDPCMTINYGEAEDYRVVFTGTVPTTDITVGTITPLTYCAGDAINVPFTISGTFNAGNTYTAQLSDASGSFANPVSLGTLTGTAAGTVNGTIPANTPFGTGYRVRIISSNPADTSTNNSVAITVNDRKPVSVSISANPAGSICSGSNVTFTATPVNGGSTPAYQWKVNGNNVGTNSATFSSTSLNNNDVVECILTSNAVCATGSPATSNSVTMSVGASFNAGTVSALTNPICAGASSTLKVTGNSGAIQWRASTDGTNYTDINGATDTTYLASPAQTTWYQVYGGTGNCTGASNAVQLTVNPLPAAPVITTSDSLICSNDSTQVCVSGGSFSTYLWNNGGTGSCTYARFAGGVWVDITDANGCGARSNRINISVYSVPSVSIIRQGDTLTSFGAVSYQWIKNGTDIAGATNPYYVADGPGDYAVRITDANGCVSTSAAVSITVGIDEVAFTKDFSVYPNPASGRFVVQYKGNKKENYRLLLFNTLGEKVKDVWLDFSTANSATVEVIDLPAGVYVIQMQSDNTSATSRIIVQQ